jgi:hypothetical protein
MSACLCLYRYYRPTYYIVIKFEVIYLCCPNMHEKQILWKLIS